MSREHSDGRTGGRQYDAGSADTEPDGPAAGEYDGG